MAKDQSNSKDLAGTQGGEAKPWSQPNMNSEWAGYKPDDKMSGGLGGNIKAAAAGDLYKSRPAAAFSKTGKKDDM